MPYDGSGNFTRVMNWQADAAAGVRIKADRHDTEDNNFASGLTNAITKDGQSQPTANIPLNGKKITNLGAPTASGDAANKAYVDAIKTFSEAISITGTDAKGKITFSGSQSPDTDPNSRPLGIGWTQADLFFGVKPLGIPAGGDVDRWVWNDEAAGTGKDVMTLTDAGLLTLDTIMSGIATAPLTLISTKADAVQGPNIVTYRRNASAAINDYIGSIYNYGRNDADADVAYTAIYNRINKTETGAHEGRMSFRVAINGALSDRIVIDTETTITKLLATDASLTSPTLVGTVTHTYNPFDEPGASPMNYVFARDSTSPAAADQIAAILFQGRTSANTVRINYARILSVMDTVTNNAEEGSLQFAAVTAGTLTTRLTVDGKGCQSASFRATGVSAILGTDTSTVGTIYFRPNGHNSTTRQATIDGATGDLVSGGDVVATSQIFRGSSGTNVYLGPNAAGTIYLRANGVTVAANQVTIGAAGNITAPANIVMTDVDVGYIKSQGFLVAGPTSTATSNANEGFIAHPLGIGYFKRNGTANQAHINFLNNAAATPATVGSIQTSGSATSYNTSSDENLKDFIGVYDPANAIEIIRADPVRDFNWKNGDGYAVGWGAQTSYSVSQDLASPPPPRSPEEIAVEGAGTDPKEPGYMPWGMDQGKRTPYLWAALTWALDRIDELMDRVTVLEAAP